MKPFLVSLLLLLFVQTLPAAVADELTLEMIPLKHRLLDDVVPILRPLLAPGGTITGMNNQLIVKSTPTNIAELKDVLQQIDQRLRKLMISVKQGTGFSGNSNDQSLSGRYRSGDVTVDNRDRTGNRDGLVISGKDKDGNIIRYRTQRSQDSRDDRQSFRVQTVEGSPAFIKTGQSIPIRNRNIYYTPEGAIVNDAVDYHDASSGFYVLPRLNGNQVTLLAAPRLTRTTPGKRPVFNVQDVQTTASGTLGEWIQLGGVSQNFNESSREILSSSGSRGSETGSVWIKVDEIK